MAYRKNIISSYFILLLISMSFIKAFDGIPKEDTYSTTWASSQYLTESNNLPPISLSNNSIRQIVHISISSPTIRLRFSNRLGESDLEIKGVTIANSVSQGSGEVDTLTLTTVTFEGKEEVAIPAKTEIYSDPFYYPLKVQSEVAVSIYFGKMPEKLTSHAGSRTFSFIEKGNKIKNKKFTAQYKTAHWYVLSAIEVSSSPAKKVAVCFGDSITDGRGSTNDKQNRWTDVFSKRLYLNDRTMDVGVVNAGIGATLLLGEAQERFERDVLDIKGCTYIVVLYGVNDIIFSNAKTEDLINGYKTLIYKAHQNNKAIYGCTILPFGGMSQYWSEEKEKIRKEINEWIRKSGENKQGFDAYFDFDKITKDPDDETKLLADCDSGDGIHPSPHGYVKMAEAIDNLKLFTVEPNFADADELEVVNKIGIKYKLDFSLEQDEKVTIKVKGRCEGSNGFRILLNNEEGKKTSEYYYTGKIEKGSFEFEVKLKAEDVCNYIVIRRPLSTINIDKIVLTSVEVEAESGKQSLSLENNWETIEE